MAIPLKGFEGTISASGTAVAWVNSWEANLEVEEQEVGPFINDGGVTYTYTTSKKITGTVEATIPNGKDPGQTAMVNAALNGNTIPITLVTTNGYTITIPSGVVTTFSMSQDAAETVTVSFDFSSNGAFTVV